MAADMRRWRAPEQADILVSELLGSFGDNELSPECLDGAQRFLKEGGVSIPQAYTSFLQPVTAAKQWNDVKVSTLCTLCMLCIICILCILCRLGCRVGLMPLERCPAHGNAHLHGWPATLPLAWALPRRPLAPSQPPAAHALLSPQAFDAIKQFETPFVIRLHRFTPLAPSLPVFTFTHPNWDEVIDNTRAASLLFECNVMGGSGERAAHVYVRVLAGRWVGGCE